MKLRRTAVALTASVVGIGLSASAGAASRPDHPISIVRPTGLWSTPLAQGNVGRVALMADALSIEPGTTIHCRNRSARRGGPSANTLLVLRIERRIPINPGESFSYTGPADVYADRTLNAAGQTQLKITGRWLLVHRHPTDLAVLKGSFSSNACAAPRRSFTAYR